MKLFLVSSLLCLGILAGCNEAPSTRIFYCSFQSMEITHESVLRSWGSGESAAFVKIELLWNGLNVGTLFDSRQDQALCTIDGEEKLPIRRSFVARKLQQYVLVKMSHKDSIACRISGLGFEGKDHVLAYGAPVKLSEGFPEISGDGWTVKLRAHE